jgi:hypothetical protein
MPIMRNKKAASLACFGIACFGLMVSTSIAAEPLLLSGSQPGNQQNPAVSFGENGGFVVWQDDKIDGRGWGVALRRLTSTLGVAPEAPILVNSQKSYNQENPRVACLQNGAGIVVWQGGRRGQGDIYSRIISPRGTWLTDEAYVNVTRAGDQVDPAVVALTGGDAMVAWTSFNQEGAYKGVFGRRVFSGGGGSEQIRLSSASGKEDFNPALAPLPGGGFVGCWVSGSKRYWRIGDREPGDAVVLARVFNSVASPVSSEIDVSPDGGFATSCDIAALPNGFAVCWIDQAKHQAFFRRFDGTGKPIGAAAALATTNRVYGKVGIATTDQTMDFAYTISKDGFSVDLVYGRSLSLDTLQLTDPALLSSVDLSVLRDMAPALSGDGSGRVFAVWSSYVRGSAFNVVGTQIR